MDSKLKEKIDSTIVLAKIFGYTVEIAKPYSYTDAVYVFYEKEKTAFTLIIHTYNNTIKLDTYVENPRRIVNNVIDELIKRIS